MPAFLREQRKRFARQDHFRFWPLADMKEDGSDVRFWGKTDTSQAQRNVGK
jgi:hypothetical protein